MKAKLVKENINNILRPKSKQDIIKDLSKFTREEKGIKLRIASLRGHKEVVKLLIEAGADLNNENNDRETALMWASENNHKEIIDLLIEAGANVNDKNNIIYKKFK